jgi:hypothetical protein
MDSNRPIRNADTRVLGVLTLIVAALIGAVALTMNDDAFDVSSWSAVSSAHAVLPRDETKVATPVDVQRDAETGAADESSQGTRPDAAH